MAHRIMTIGIMSRTEFREYALAIARGDIVPKKGQPSIYFESMESMAQVLSDKNRELLKIIRDNNPGSLRELVELSQRKASNLSRTLKTMENYGIVELIKEQKNIKPRVRVKDFRVVFGLA